MRGGDGGGGGGGGSVRQCTKFLFGVGEVERECGGGCDGGCGTVVVEGDVRSFSLVIGKWVCEKWGGKGAWC